MSASSSRQLAEEVTGIAQPAVARLVAVDRSRDRVLIEVQPNGPAISARVAFHLDASAMDRAIAARKQALVVFENADPSLPIVVGLLAACATPSPLHAISAAADAAETAPEPAPSRFVVEADADGKRVQIEAQDELVLRCGQATITLRRNGKVIVRGAHVETYATGTNRIKGGQVRVN